MFLDFKGIVPYADRYTADTDKVDALLCSFEILLRTGRSLRTRSADGREWAHVIRRMVDRFLDIPADIPEEETVRQTLYETLARLAVFELSSEQKHYHLPFEFIRNYLKENLAAGGYSRGSYLSSGVNISALVPKRQIPFRIIYLMGMHSHEVDDPERDLPLRHERGNIDAGTQVASPRVAACGEIFFEVIPDEFKGEMVVFLFRRKFEYGEPC